MGDIDVVSFNIHYFKAYYINMIATFIGSISGIQAEYLHYLDEPIQLSNEVQQKSYKTFCKTLSKMYGKNSYEYWIKKEHYKKIPLFRFGIKLKKFILMKF